MFNLILFFTAVTSAVLFSGFFYKPPVGEVKGLEGMLFCEPSSNNLKNMQMRSCAYILALKEKAKIASDEAHVLFKSSLKNNNNTDLLESGVQSILAANYAAQAREEAKTTGGDIEAAKEFADRTFMLAAIIQSQITKKVGKEEYLSFANGLQKEMESVFDSTNKSAEANPDEAKYPKFEIFEEIMTRFVAAKSQSELRDPTQLLAQAEGTKFKSESEVLGIIISKVQAQEPTVRSANSTDLTQHREDETRKDGGRSGAFSDRPFTDQSGLSRTSGSNTLAYEIGGQDGDGRVTISGHYNTGQAFSLQVTPEALAACGCLNDNGHFTNAQTARDFLATNGISVDQLPPNSATTVAPAQPALPAGVVPPPAPALVVNPEPVQVRAPEYVNTFTWGNIPPPGPVIASTMAKYNENLSITISQHGPQGLIGLSYAYRDQAEQATRNASTANLNVRSALDLVYSSVATGKITGMGEAAQANVAAANANNVAISTITAAVAAQSALNNAYINGDIEDMDLNLNAYYAGVLAELANQAYEQIDPNDKTLDGQRAAALKNKEEAEAAAAQAAGLAGGGGGQSAGSGTPGSDVASGGDSGARDGTDGRSGGDGQSTGDTPGGQSTGTEGQDQGPGGGGGD